MNGYAAREHSVDCGALYESIRRDLISVVLAADPSDLEALVAATPEWRVRDVVAHVTGIAEDLNAGNFGDGDPDAFTRVQVVRHQDSPLPEVIATWDREAPQFEAGLRLLGYQIGNHFVGDLFIHFVDVVTTLGHPVDRDSTAVWVSLDWYLDALEAAETGDDRGALEVITGPERRIIGSGEVSASVMAAPFEILRACAGRRSAAQIARFDWSGESDLFQPRLSQYSTPSIDVTD
ncbi:MAG: maleylpyruvate isomerase N-terminal domain-containing protein [Acidimicrobiia bacterium]|nr:maleylpyruvate isomerase N-terminal domain-containing protein [Acidimicrobiia bacterium]